MNRCRHLPIIARDTLRTVQPITTAARIASLRPTAVNHITQQMRALQAQGRDIVSLMRGDGIAARKRIWILQGKGDSWPSRDQPFPPQPGITTTPP